VRGKAALPPPPRLALRRRGLHGLESVLAERCEVDQQIGCIGEPAGELSASSVHASQPMPRGGQKAPFAGGLASHALVVADTLGEPGDLQRFVPVEAGVDPRDLAVA
jgi:hypothetical protein